MSKYQITYNKIINWLVPWFLRTPDLTNLIDASAKHLQDLNDDYVIFTDEIDNFLKYDSRIIYLEKFLNDNYDNTLRRIYIVNLTVIKSPYVYSINDVDTVLEFYTYSITETPSFIYPYVYSITELPTFNNYNFKIMVPVAVTTTDATIINNTDPYVLAGIEYTIERF